MAFGDLVKFDVDTIGGGDTTSCDLGSNPTSGNILIFCAYGGSGGQSIVTPPSGMTLLEINTTTFVAAVYWKLSNGTEQTAGHVHGNTNAVGATYAEYDVDGNTSPTITSAENTDNISSDTNTQTAGTLTPVSSTNIMLGFAFTDGLGDIASAEAWTSSYTLDIDVINDSSITAVGKHTNRTGSQSPEYSYTGSAEQMYGVLIDISFSSGPTLSGPDTTTEQAATVAAGTDLDTVTTFSLKTDDDAFTIEQTIDAATATTLDYDAESGVNDVVTPGSGGAVNGIPVEATIAAAGTTAYQIQQEADDGTDTDSRNITLNPESGFDVIQTTIAVANTDDDESIFGSSYITVEDDMQAYVPDSANGMNITWAADGTFTTDANQTETIEVRYLSPANQEWSSIDFTIDLAKEDQTISFADAGPIAMTVPDTQTNTASGGAGIGAITYASGTGSVATVNVTTGEVTAVAEGSSIITATKAADDDYNEAQDTYTVNVSEAPVPGDVSGNQRLSLSLKIGL
jgi:hypothetical protein